MQITLNDYCTLLSQALEKYRNECPLLPNNQSQFWGFNNTHDDDWQERYPNSFRNSVFLATGGDMSARSFGASFNPRYPIVGRINALTEEAGLGELALPELIWRQLEWIIQNKAHDTVTVRPDFLNILSQYVVKQDFNAWQQIQKTEKKNDRIALYKAFFWTVLRDDLWEAHFVFRRDEDNNISVEASHLFANDLEHISRGQARKGEDDIIEIDLIQSRLNHSANIKAYSTPLLHFPHWGIFAGHYLAVSGNPGRPITVRPIIFVPAEQVTETLRQGLREKLLHLRRDTKSPSDWWKIGPEFLIGIQGLARR